MGASIAFHLAEAGVRDVLLLERDHLAGGSTCKAAGGVRAQFSDAVNIALGARSLLAFEDFANRPGAEIDLHQVGYLFLHTDPDQAQTAREAVDLQNSMGVPTRLLTADEAVALNPTITDTDVLLATFHPRDGHCTPEAVVHGYASAARRLGATVRTGVEVTGVRVRRRQASPPCEPAAAPCAPRRSSARPVPGRRAIGEMVGVDLPVHPLRRQILITEPLAPELEASFPADMPFTIDAATTFYLHREGPGVLLGMSYRGEQPGFRDDYSEDWYPDLVEAIELRCPELLQVGIAHRWVGLYEVTPDHNALVGRSTAVPGFLYATGFSGHGFLQGPAIGEVIRDLYLEPRTGHRRDLASTPTGSPQATCSTSSASSRTGGMTPLEAIRSAILARHQTSGGPVIVAIDGRSGAGKSTLARSLAGPLSASVVVGDDFYADLDESLRWALLPAEGADRYFDWRRLRDQALLPLREGLVARYLPFDWVAGSGLAPSLVRVDSSDVVIVEGVYTARPQLREVVDVTVLLVADEQERRSRLARRAHGNERWLPRWEAAENHYFAALRPPESFDLVLTDVDLIDLDDRGGPHSAKEPA